MRELIPEAEKPEMTAGCAAIIKVMSVYREMRYALSQIEVQKMTYFLVRGGQDLPGREIILPRGRRLFSCERARRGARNLRFPVARVIGCRITGFRSRACARKVREITAFRRAAHLA